MNVLEQLRNRLASLEPQQLEIVDHSAAHAGHAGSGGGAHFQITIVSPHFAGLGSLQRHRLVYDAAGDLMQHAIHALSIKAQAPEEAAG